LAGKRTLHDLESVLVIIYIIWRLSLVEDEWIHNLNCAGRLRTITERSNLNTLVNLNHPLLHNMIITKKERALHITGAIKNSSFRLGWDKGGMCKSFRQTKMVCLTTKRRAIYLFYNTPHFWDDQIMRIFLLLLLTRNFTF